MDHNFEINHKFMQPLPRTTRIGVLGGGQLGRMLGLAAANLGVSIVCMDPNDNAPASIIAAQMVKGNVRDPVDVERFAATVDVLTVETEHIDAVTLESIVQRRLTDVQPLPSTLRLIQDKHAQKQHFRASGIALGDFDDAPNKDALEKLANEFGYPLMLKSKRMAYDGRGNCAVTRAEELESAVAKLGGFESGLYAERWQNFTKELAVIVVRSRSGEVRTYPVTKTVQKNNICHVTEQPASISSHARRLAEKLAADAVRALDGAGVFGVEMFLFEGEMVEYVLLNEVAPRVHNSGHGTMNGCVTSQFENHIPALLNWPLGDTSMGVGHCIMLNILGEADGEPGELLAKQLIDKALRTEGCSVHWYEKKALRARKLGHINVVGSSKYEARARLGLLSETALFSLAGKSEEEDVRVAIIMGSDSDLPTMAQAAGVLEDEFQIKCLVTVVSAHRTPERLVEFATSAHTRGIKVIIAGAGGAAHLPGMVAAMTPLPVIGVPVKPAGASLDGLDALLSIVQMPKGVPVATVAIGNAANAGLLAVRILASSDPALQDKMVVYQTNMREVVENKALALEKKGWRDYLKA